MIGYRRALLKVTGYNWFRPVSKYVVVPLDRMLYERSGGRFSVVHAGSGRGALQTLLLTTTGRKTGEARTSPVLYLDEGDTFVVVGSNFARKNHPAWTANLLADPRATVQVRGRRLDVRARPATEAERDALWPRLLEVYPTWEVYRRKTDRGFRAFFLEPA